MSKIEIVDALRMLAMLKSTVSINDHTLQTEIDTKISEYLKKL